MGFIELFILAIGLSMDAFAVSICKGLSLGKIQWKHIALAGLWFGGFQALMPAIGYFLGSFFAELVSHIAPWIAFLLLLFIGGNMIKESREHTDELDDKMDMKTMFLLAVATSIDALAVGVSLAFLQVPILAPVLFIGCVTFVCSAIGIKIGSLFGMVYKSKAEFLGGLVLICIGLRILLKGLGILP